MSNYPPSTEGYEKLPLDKIVAGITVAASIASHNDPTIDGVARVGWVTTIFLFIRRFWRPRR